MSCSFPPSMALGSGPGSETVVMAKLESCLRAGQQNPWRTRYGAIELDGHRYPVSGTKGRVVHCADAYLGPIPGSILDYNDVPDVSFVASTWKRCLGSRLPSPKGTSAYGPSLGRSFNSELGV